MWYIDFWLTEFKIIKNELLGVLLYLKFIEIISHIHVDQWIWNWL